MRLRQIALVGRDLDRIAADITAVLGLGRAFDDPGVRRYGLRNQVWPLGDTFLEVVSPNEEGTTAGRLLDKRGHDGGYMTIFQVDDGPAARARVVEHGVRIVDRVERDGVSFAHLHPKDLPGAIASIDTMEPKERWEWGGPDWQGEVREQVVGRIRGAEIEIADAVRISQRWAEALGLERSARGAVWVLALDGGELRFAEAPDGAGQGLCAIDVEVRDAEALMRAACERGCLDAAGEVVLCGVRLRAV